MKHYLVGKRLYLRGLTQNEIGEPAPYYSWLNDLRLDQYTNRSDFPHSLENIKQYVERAQISKALVLLGIFDVITDKHIGNITLQEFDWVNRRALIGYLLGDHEFAGKGFATEAVQMMMYYGFNRLNLEKIHTTISARNTPSLKVAAKSGMIEEGRMRRHLLRNGEWTDLLIFGALRAEWIETTGENAARLFAHPPA